MKCALIGEKLSHSFSSRIHSEIGLYDYTLNPLSREEFSRYMEKRDFDGINVTIPYKRDVIPYLDFLSPEARKCGAVNTVVNREGKLYGFNTDFLGLESLFTHSGISAEGKKALILGSGGTSLTALALLQSLGAREIYRVSRGEKEGCITYAEAEKNHGDADLLVNTTPCGMYPDTDGCPVDLSCFPRLLGVVDVIYNPLKTRLLLEAEKRGIPCAGGLYMLIAQAVYAAQIFTGREDLLPLIPSLFEDIKREKENLVLIGMPGCGKSTLGKALSEKLGKTFVDSDEEIVKEAGMTIPEIFKKEGEKAFRHREEKVIARLSMETGLVMATGGGAVLREENVKRLSQNGRLLFLDAPLETLVATEDRPLSQTKEALTKLYFERYDIYKKSADRVIDITRDKKENLEKILKVLK